MNNNKRIILDYSELKRIIDAHRVLGHKIVSTVGSWDMLHIGHLRYLIKAKAQGDILVVGADSDRGIKLYKKNDLRPVIPQKERMEMLSYQDCVDYVTLIDDIDAHGKWQYELIKVIQPDLFVATTDSYPEEQLKEIQSYCGGVLVFSRQAKDTSTTKVVEKMIKKHLEVILSNFREKQ